MIKVNRACLNCKFYYAFYIKGIDCFEKQSCGICRKCQDIKEKNSICEKWDYNSESSRLFKSKMRKENSFMNINRMMNSLTEICQILKEEHEEEK